MPEHRAKASACTDRFGLLKHALVICEKQNGSKRKKDDAFVFMVAQAFPPAVSPTFSRLGASSAEAR
jgi:hypothetical protein